MVTKLTAITAFAAALLLAAPAERAQAAVPMTCPIHYPDTYVVNDPLDCSFYGNSTCGSVTTFCGQTLNCGTCSPGDVCVDRGSQCVWDGPPSQVTGGSATMCWTQNANVHAQGICAENDQLFCENGGCPASQTCWDKGTYCCHPRTCASIGQVCGLMDNGCGQQVNCGSCPGGQECHGSPGTCCQPVSSAGRCGLQDDGCGFFRDYGTCAGGVRCETSGQCCVPQTCAQRGLSCGTWDDGCGAGGKISCGSCGSGTECMFPTSSKPSFGTCCLPTKTCANQGAICGSIDDGCGHTINCGPGCNPATHCSPDHRSCLAGPPAPPSVPASGPWGLAGMVGMLMVAGTFMLRRRQRRVGMMLLFFGATLAGTGLAQAAQPFPACCDPVTNAACPANEPPCLLGGTDPKAADDRYYLCCDLTRNGACVGQTTPCPASANYAVSVAAHPKICCAPDGCIPGDSKDAKDVTDYNALHGCDNKVCSYPEPEHACIKPSSWTFFTDAQWTYGPFPSGAQGRLEIVEVQAGDEMQGVCLFDGDYDHPKRCMHLAVKGSAIHWGTLDWQWPLTAGQQFAQCYGKAPVAGSTVANPCLSTDTLMDATIALTAKDGGSCCGPIQQVTSQLAATIKGPLVHLTMSQEHPLKIVPSYVIDKALMGVALGPTMTTVASDIPQTTPPPAPTPDAAAAAPKPLQELRFNEDGCSYGGRQARGGWVLGLMGLALVHRRRRV